MGWGMEYITPRLYVMPDEHGGDREIRDAALVEELRDRINAAIKTIVDEPQYAHLLCSGSDL